MADTKQKPTLAVGFNLPTAIRAVLPNGRLLSSDGSVWLVRKAPLQPIADAKSTTDRIEAFLPLLAAYEELAAMAPVNMTRRAVARKNYRQTHMLMVNTPKVYVPQQGNKNAAFLKEVFPQEVTEQRVLMLAVRLVDKIGGDGGMKAAVDSIVETLVAGNTPMSDFDTDERKVDAALARCGFSVPNQAEIHMANSWWNQGRFPDTVSLPHSDHMHIFSDTAAARMADDAGRNDCANWPHIPSHRSLTLAVLENFDFSFLSPSEVFANWAVGLLADGAVAISIRGNIEPAKVTRAELRRQRKRYLDDINERFQHGKMELAEQTEMEDVLRDVEDIYATQGGSPTIVDASVLVAFDGEVEDISTAGAGTSAQLRVMNLRQSQAMAEMMLCSHIRANPVLHDMPSQNIACSGIQSLSMVGDRTGALLGFTQRDRQPVLFDPKASTNEDVGPIAVHVGSTGSGKTQMLLWKAVQYDNLGIPQIFVDPKALALDTRIPTPTGWTTMGEIKVGEQVIGRDGNPCNVVHKSRIFTADETRLYEFLLDDGQVIRADQNHMWVVSSMFDRRRALKTPERGARADRDLAIVDKVAGAYADSDMVTIKDLMARLESAGFESFNGAERLRVVLKNQGAGPSVPRAGSQPAIWAARVGLKALSNHLKAFRDSFTTLQELTTDQLLDGGVKTTNEQSNWAIPVPEAVNYPAQEQLIPAYLLGAWLGDGTSKSGDICAGAQDSDEIQELLSQVWPNIKRRSERDGALSVFALGRDYSTCLYGHQDYVQVGRQSRCATCERDRQAAYQRGEKVDFGDPVNPSLQHLLRKIGVLRDKHIPAQYLRGSIEQRLELLRGIMDTDGTVKKRGDCKVVFTSEKLAKDTLMLVRSLGIKAQFWVGDAVLSTRDPDGGENIRRRTGASYEISFRTSHRVFKLQRKLDLQPAGLVTRSQWNYIKDIRLVDSEPAQCIRVDSLDHTYLVADFVPTHNTGSDHSQTIENVGGHVTSLDELASADGIFDPIRFSSTAAVGVELAVSMLSSIDPWGGEAKKFEVDLYRALSYGVNHGAQCIGEALDLAQKAKWANEALCQPIFRLAESSPTFRACVGIYPNGEALRVADGLTYIKTGGMHLELPEPGAMASASLTQRIGMALVRMMVFGSLMALEGRGGVIHLDEAWVFLGAGKDEVQRLGRLARSQNVTAELYTQRISDALEAKLDGYISRGTILPTADEFEARAALALFHIEATADRVAAITAKGTIGGVDSVTPNWNSMRALRDPDTRKVLRGTIGIVSDLAGRAVPVHIKLPEVFLKLSSTTPSDIAARKKAMAVMGA